MRNDKLNGAALLVLRLGLGVIFLAHGSQKLLGWLGGHGWSASIDFMNAQFGVPAFLAGIAILTEFFGALLLISGVFTRLSAAAIVIHQLVAMFLVHWKFGFFLNFFGQLEPGQEGIEFNLALIVMSLALVLAGAGRYSLDRFMSEIFRARKQSSDQDQDYRTRPIRESVV